MAASPPTRTASAVATRHAAERAASLPSLQGHVFLKVKKRGLMNDGYQPRFAKVKNKHLLFYADEHALMPSKDIDLADVFCIEEADEGCEAKKDRERVLMVRGQDMKTKTYIKMPSTQLKDKWIAGLTRWLSATPSVEKRVIEAKKMQRLEESNVDPALLTAETREQLHKHVMKKSQSQTNLPTNDLKRNPKLSQSMPNVQQVASASGGEAARPGILSKSGSNSGSKKNVRIVEPVAEEEPRTEAIQKSAPPQHTRAPVVRSSSAEAAAAAHASLAANSGRTKGPVVIVSEYESSYESESESSSSEYESYYEEEHADASKLTPPPNKRGTQHHTRTPNTDISAQLRELQERVARSEEVIQKQNAEIERLRTSPPKPTTTTTTATRGADVSTAAAKESDLVDIVQDLQREIQSKDRELNELRSQSRSQSTSPERRPASRMETSRDSNRTRSINESALSIQERLALLEEEVKDILSESEREGTTTPSPTHSHSHHRHNHGAHAHAHAHARGYANGHDVSIGGSDSGVGGSSSDDYEERHHHHHHHRGHDHHHHHNDNNNNNSHSHTPTHTYGSHSPPRSPSSAAKYRLTYQERVAARGEAGVSTQPRQTHHSHGTHGGFTRHSPRVGERSESMSPNRRVLGGPHRLSMSPSPLRESRDSNPFRTNRGGADYARPATTTSIVRAGAARRASAAATGRPTTGRGSIYGRTTNTPPSSIRATATSSPTYSPINGGNTSPQPGSRAHTLLLARRRAAAARASQGSVGGSSSVVGGGVSGYGGVYGGSYVQSPARGRAGEGDDVDRIVERVLDRVALKKAAGRLHPNSSPGVLV